MQPKEPPQKYSLDELCGLVDVPKRTVRYYIQIGLLDRPIGETRAAYYGEQHLQQLVQIRSLISNGINLEKISHLVKAGAQVSEVPSAKPGDLCLMTHIHLASGVELVIDSARSNLSSEQVRRIANGAVELLKKTKESDERKH